jgi:hypothetical protein
LDEVSEVMKRDKIETADQAKADDLKEAPEDDFEGDISELIEQEESYVGSRKINYDDEEFEDGEVNYQLDDSELGFDSYDEYDDDDLDDEDYYEDDYDDDYEDY